MSTELLNIVREEYKETRAKLPSFAPGDTIVVHYKIKEGDKERIQQFQGTEVWSIIDFIISTLYSFGGNNCAQAKQHHYSGCDQQRHFPKASGQDLESGPNAVQPTGHLGYRGMDTGHFKYHGGSVVAHVGGQGWSQLDLGVDTHHAALDASEGPT